MRIYGKQFFIVFLTSIIFLQIFSLSASASVITETLYPISDTYVDAYEPNRNFGGADRFEIMEEYYDQNTNFRKGENAYLKFDMSTVPDQATIINADLSIYLWVMQGKQSTCSVSVHYCNDISWDELLITWNNAPKFDTVAIDTNNLISYIKTRYSWEVTNVIIKSLSADKLTLVLKAVDVSAYSLEFWSKDSYQAWAPILNITYMVPNELPKANGRYSPLNPTVDSFIQFTDISTDKDGNIQSWLWDFGDGITANAKNPTHKYQTIGNYSITLTVTDNEGGVDSTSFIISITEPQNDDSSGQISGTDISENNNGLSNKTPGFEVILVLFVIFLSLIQKRKK